MDGNSSSVHIQAETNHLIASGASPAHTSASVAAAPRPGGGEGAGDTAGQTSKRRRGPGIVTPNACTECRRKRAKCDGQMPCGRCKAQDIDDDCAYEIPVRQSKEGLRTEIEQLRQRQRSCDGVIAALKRPDLWQEVLQRLRSGQPVETISDWLDHGSEAHEMGFTSPGDEPEDVPAPLSGLSPVTAFAGGGPGSFSAMDLGVGPVTTQAPGQAHGDAWQLGDGHHVKWEPPHTHHESASWAAAASPLHVPVVPWDGNLNPAARAGGGGGGETSRTLGLFGRPERATGPILPVPPPDPTSNPGNPASTWTDITYDLKLVNHLLALYFCWEYPTFASLSKEHFMKDFRGGRDRFCSSILVNALLALGCRFSTRPSTRADPADPYSSGDHFFRESQRLLRAEADHHSLTTIQALGIMAIREASFGRDSESLYYSGQSIRLAIEVGLHRIEGGVEDDEMAVKCATFWGAFALDHAWSLATGSLPQCSSYPRLPPKPAIKDAIEASVWIPYTDDGVAMQPLFEQPSNVRSVYKCFCELSELVHQSLYILHSPGRPLNSRSLLDSYTQYLDWYGKIPEILRLGQNFTPAVLFAHMYYHFAILILFRPFIKLSIVGSNVLPRDVCSQAADAIQGLLKSYSSLYTLQRTPSFVPYFVLTSCIMHLAIAASAPGARSAAVFSSPNSSPNPGFSGLRIDVRTSQALERSVSYLVEMAPCHQFAEQALNILRYLTKKWGIDVDISKASGEAGQPRASTAGSDMPMEMEVAIERLMAPRTGGLNFFAPHVRTSDFISTLGPPTDVGRPGGDISKASNATNAGENGNAVRDAREAATEKTANPMDHPLFWPFPMQGRPLLPDGNNLEKAGFAFLPNI